MRTKLDLAKALTKAWAEQGIEVEYIWNPRGKVFEVYGRDVLKVANYKEYHDEQSSLG